jgi:polysaccharide export outer membrane protein
MTRPLSAAALSFLAGLSLLLAASPVSAQIFPTLDPNAPPPVTKKLSAPNPAPAPVEPVQPVQPVTESVPAKIDTRPALPAVSKTLDNPPAAVESYLLGPQDTITVKVVNMEEMGDEPYPIDLTGYVTLPRIGRVQAAGMTIEQLRDVLVRKFKDYLQDPIVTVTITEFHSQPVSILGAVGTPGVHQIKGQKTLFEVISEAGGLKDDAGNTITITRQMVNGTLPLPNAQTDPSGRFSIAELNIRSVMSARSPQDNIPVKPYDVITVPKADLIYVIGAVKRPGGFPLTERANMTVLEALSLSQGLDKAAASKRAQILRTDESTHAHLKIPVDVQKILDGKNNDQPLLSNDILFIPTSAVKQASYRAIEAIIQTGTGLAIYRP